MAHLHHEQVVADGEPPRRWLLLTHGIFGAGGNWRSIARKLTRARPEYGCALVDLRNHGRSEEAPPPHTLEACADDVGELLGALAQQGAAIGVAAGHSFGGKVVAMLRQRCDRHAAAAAVRQWWMLDSSPSARPPPSASEPGSVPAVLATLEALPAQLGSRPDFEARIMDAGHPRSLAQWLALNLVPSGDGVRLRLPLPAVRSMLESYYAADLWPSLRDPRSGDVHLLIAARSSTVSAADRGALAASPPHLHTHYVDADHWLHVDAPDAVVAHLAAALP